MNISPVQQMPGASGRGLPDPDDASAGDAPAPADGRSARWDGHRQARRDELVSAVRKAVHRHGSAVSMDDIALHTGVAKPVLYRYFGDKAGLQRAVGETVIDRMESALSAAARSASSPRERLRAMVTVYLEMAESSPNVYAFVTSAQAGPGTAEAAPAPLNHFFEAVTAMVALPFREQRPDPSNETGGDWAADQWAAAAIGFVRGSGEWWIEHRGRPGTPPRPRVAEQITAWLWSGLTGPSAPSTNPPARKDP